MRLIYFNVAYMRYGAPGPAPSTKGEGQGAGRGDNLRRILTPYLCGSHAHVTEDAWRVSGASPTPHHALPDQTK